MKRIGLSAIIFLLASNVLAQETATSTSKAERRNELGLILMESSTDRNENVFSQGSYGVQYKRWKSDNTAYRLGLMHTSLLRDEGIVNRQVLGVDTFAEQRKFTRANMPVLTVGMEAQRQFYKKIYFYAAADARFGWGTADTETRTEKEFSYMQDNKLQYGRSVTSTGRSSGMNMFRMSVVPMLGVKMQSERWGVGYEVASHILSFTQLKGKGTTQSELDFALNNYTTRLYITYRFK